jgi:Delta7-sterol 5-desaturase
MIEPDVFTSELVGLLLWLSFGKPLAILIITVICELPSSRNLHIFNIQIFREQTIRELKSTWLIFTDAFMLMLLVKFNIVRFGSNSPINIMLTFSAFFLWIEIWFYWCHRLMHKNNLLWKVHEYHHLSEINQPLTASSFSMVEKFVFYTCGWFLLPTVVSWFNPLSTLGVGLYFAYYYASSAIAHSNTELTYSFQKHLPFGIGKCLGSATGHALHHARYDTNFGLLSSIPDRLFGTYAKDTEKVQQKVSSGESLENLQVAIES